MGVLLRLARWFAPALITLAVIFVLSTWPK